MPIIKINEIESTTFAAFDVTENTVLIPLLYSRKYDSIPHYNDSETTLIDYYTYRYQDTETINSKLYTDATVFRDDFRYDNGFDHVVYVDDEVDKSFIMAYELLLQGMKVVIKPIAFNSIDYFENNTDEKPKVKMTLFQMYKMLQNKIYEEHILNEFKDRNIYNLKFLTTGAYANIGAVCIDEDSTEGKDFTATTSTVIRNIAAVRGDAIALVEFKEFFNDEDSLIKEINSYASTDSNDTFSAAFFPWCEFMTTATGKAEKITMPANFAYLMAFADSVKSNANWFAASGVIRGSIPNLYKPIFEVGEALMHTLQQDEWASTNLSATINPIYNAGSYGYRIWGNKVFLKTNSVTVSKYMSFLNVRILLCDIKKQIYHSAMRCTFEPNDDIVWINFKTLTNSLLERMKSGRGLKWYKWTKEVVTEKATIKATLTIQPIEAVESFDISILLTDDEASIEEVNNVTE